MTPITGKGTQRIQPIWLDDVAEHFALAVTEDAATNRTFDLGGPDAVSWNEFWERLKRTLGVRRPSVHMPMWFMRANATVTERLPGNIPLTRDQRPDPETYLHRIGRTGRFGRKGCAINFVYDNKSKQDLADIEEHYARPITQAPADDIEELEKLLAWE